MLSQESVRCCPLLAHHTIYSALQAEGEEFDPLEDDTQICSYGLNCFFSKHLNLLSRNTFVQNNNRIRR